MATLDPLTIRIQSATPSQYGGQEEELDYISKPENYTGSNLVSLQVRMSVCFYLRHKFLIVKRFSHWNQFCDLAAWFRVKRSQFIFQIFFS